jgi:hypothetical protein
LGTDGYYFITMDDKTSNPNVFKSIPYGDIEGVWSYVYFSYSSKVNQAVGFIKYGTSDVQRVEIAVTHNSPKFLRFLLGGNDLGVYPGFNGQFTRPVLKIGPGSFLATAEEI